MGLDVLYSAAVELKEWVKAARAHKGLTQGQLGDELGLTKGNISGWENGRHEPSYAQLLKIEQITGYALDQQTHPAGGILRDIAHSPYGMMPILAWEHETDLPEGEYILVPRLNIHLSAGGGKEQIELELAENTPLAFRADWVRKMHLKPKRLAAMTASGRSMEPTIWDGDSLVVDTSQADVSDGQVYALWYDGGERVKRLFRLPGGGLRIKSDNIEHGTIELGPDYTGHVRIIGRVVHRSGTGGL